MGLSDESRSFIARVREAGIPSVHTLAVEDARTALKRRRDLHVRNPEPVFLVEDIRIEGGEAPIAARFYRPVGTSGLPLVVYFHGGGWVLGDLDTSDPQCRALANATPCAVLSVDYRRAPEHKYPAAVEDAWAALRWASLNADDLGCDATQLAVGGDSAGGNLAAVMALLARDAGGPPLVFQLLTYPILDHSFDTLSYRSNAEGYILTRDDMRWFWGHYLAEDSQGEEWKAAPMRSGDLGRLPPALIMSAEFDVLRDEAEDYARLLESAGVPVAVQRFDGAIHGFLGMCDDFVAGRLAVVTAAQHLRRAFRRD